MRRGLAYDDVLIVPCYTELTSRTQPVISVEMGGISFSKPIISSPMDTVTEAEMAIKMGESGGLGILHRFCSIKDQIGWLKQIKDYEQEKGTKIPSCFSVGVGQEERERFLSTLKEVDADFVLVDIANGHSSFAKEMIEWIQDKKDIPVIAGNIATYEGFLFLAELGCVGVRAGIGSGSICSTRIKTGIGVPILQTLLDCRKTYSGFEIDYFQKANKKTKLIADGGIRYPADLCKAICAGADFIMAGNIFAGCEESPSPKVLENGNYFKYYRGAASKEIQEDKRGGLKKDTCAEGVATYIPYVGPVESVLSEFMGGLRSSMTYLNAKTLSDMRKNSDFIEITNSGLSESHAFGTRK